MAAAPETNRFAIWSLVATGVLLFPVAVIFALVAAVQILRSQGRQGGWLFVAISLLISGVVAPGAVYAMMTGRPKAFDQCYHTQEQAVSVMRLISYLEEQHRDEHGRYGTLEEIGFRPKVSTKPYSFRVEVSEKDRFLAVGRGEGAMDGDLLTIDQSKQVQRIHNRCKLQNP